MRTVIDALADLPAPFVAVTVILCGPTLGVMCVTSGPRLNGMSSSLHSIAAEGSVPSTGSLTLAL